MPEGQHDKLARTDVVILLNMVFEPSHYDEAAIRRTIAAIGVAPFISACSSTRGSNELGGARA